MKQFKKLMLILMCTGVIMGLTACGTDKNAEDNGATNNTTTTDNTVKPMIPTPMMLPTAQATRIALPMRSEMTSVMALMM